MCCSYIEVAEVTGAEGGISEPTETAEQSAPHLYCTKSDAVSSDDDGGGRKPLPGSVSDSGSTKPMTGAGGATSQPPDQPLTVHIVSEKSHPASAAVNISLSRILEQQKQW